MRASVRIAKNQIYLNKLLLLNSGLAVSVNEITKNFLFLIKENKQTNKQINIGMKILAIQKIIKSNRESGVSERERERRDCKN